MNLHEYISKKGRGSIGELADQIGAHRPDVSRWASGKRVVPEKSAVAIEVATQGAVSRRDLRPNDWQDIWPELAQSATQVEEVAHG
jgi:DNA-binding transcriptional regulator YdaS (Cro superfamily)